MDFDVNSMYAHKVILNSVYGSLGEVRAPMDQLTTAIRNSWKKWPEIKDTVVDFGFSEWVKREGGFEYRSHYSGQRAIVTKIYDEQKYVWFLLKWS